MQTFPIARGIIATQISAPANSAAFASLRSLLTAPALAKLGSQRVIEARLVPAGSTIELRTDAADPGAVLDADVCESIPVDGADGVLIRSTTTSAVTVRALLLVA